MIYIYALINPLTGHVFYVGATSDPSTRIKAHQYERNSNQYKCNEIYNITRAGYSLEMLILETCNQSDARFLEEFYIELFTFYGFKLDQIKTSTYGKIPSNKPPIFIKTVNKISITYILRWVENGITCEIKYKYAMHNRPKESKVKSCLYKEYEQKKSHTKCMGM